VDAQIQESIRQQLQVRRGRLRDIIPAAADPAPFVRLLDEVDDALGRMAQGTYGLCVVCHDEVEERRLRVDPLLRNCLDHLTAAQQRALEQDLELAERLQRDLLPRPDLTLDGWEIGYRYEPLGHVSGDYCDVTALPEGGMFFALGDVSGKGIAASIMMSHLHATFRSLVSMDLPLDEVMARANRLFCESTGPATFATLICGRAQPGGELQMCNAGHLPPILSLSDGLRNLQATGLPLGLFCAGEYRIESASLRPGDSLVIYTDGLSEARNSVQEEYGQERIADIVRARCGSPPAELVAACMEDLARFTAGTPRFDDLALLALRRVQSSAD
jgi:sigma-B regulation protein RsbU (phosphoserine phosphatase)